MPFCYPPPLLEGGLVGRATTGVAPVPDPQARGLGTLQEEVAVAPLLSRRQIHRDSAVAGPPRAINFSTFSVIYVSGIK